MAPEFAKSNPDTVIVVTGDPHARMPLPYHWFWGPRDRFSHRRANVPTDCGSVA